MTRARRVTVGTARVRFAALEDVIIHTIIAGRPRDLEDVRTLLLKNAQSGRALPGAVQPDLGSDPLSPA
ncbi:MAG: hypothetical protein NZ742_08610 [Acidobacteria bacterium]|nr:hypothetical protein [Acidobacteriota bacterium]MDW7984881.1 hypothetical protein [Acidobacteriota bacterium]